MTNEEIAMTSKIKNLEDKSGIEKELAGLIPFDFLFSHTPLYGSRGTIIFDVQKVDPKEVVKLFDTIKIVRANGNWAYTIPETELNAIQSKEPRLKVLTESDVVITLGNKLYSIHFYGYLGGYLYNVKIDYSILIIKHYINGKRWPDTIPHYIDDYRLKNYYYYMDEKGQKSDIKTHIQYGAVYTASSFENALISISFWKEK